MAQAPKPTNTEVVRLLDRILRELADSKKRQQQLAEDIVRIGKALEQ